MPGLVNIGLTGLKSSQTSLNVTGNNVANANTEGYSRQRTELAASHSLFTGAGYIGSGVKVTDINRLTDQFAIDQVRVDSSLSSEVDKFLAFIGQIDNLLADTSTGLMPAMNNLFNSFQSAGDDPGSIPERQLILSQTESLINRFDVIVGRLDSLKKSAEQDIRAQVATLNGLASGVTQLNEAITESVGLSQGKDPNELLDQRDELIRQISEIVSVTAIERDDGQTDILIGKGQALVVGSNVNQLQITSANDDPGRLQISMLENGSLNNVTGELSGGKLGGLLQFLSESLVGSYNSLGRIALTLADTINQQHHLGMDLEDDLGGDFFTDINSPETQLRRVIPNEQNGFPKDRVVSLEVTDVTQLTGDEYELLFRGPSLNDVLISNAATDEFITGFTLPGVFPAELEFNGLKIHLTSGSFQVGDKFLLTPTRDGAREINQNIARVEDIALAYPIRTSTDLGNIGNAVISQGEMLAVNSLENNSLLPTWQVPGELTPPILVRFISDDYYQVLDNTDPANPESLNPPLDNQRYIPGISNDLFTSDPGQSSVNSLGTDISQVVTGTGSNGYGPQNIHVEMNDPETGLLTGTASVSIAPDATAETIAAQLSSVSGVAASAFTEVSLSNFTDDLLGASPALTLTVEEFDSTGTSVLIPVSLGTSFDPNDIADEINNNSMLQSHNFIAWSDGSTLTVRNLTGEDIMFTLAGGATDTVDIESDFTSAPTTMTGGDSVTIGGRVDLWLDSGINLRADNASIFEQFPTTESSFLGYQAQLSGTPQQGDIFFIEYNNGGVSDNRNALKLIELETTGLIDQGVSTYGEAYSELVEITGSATNQAKLDAESSRTLLRQSEARLEEISGVNLDEEAGKLILFQASYNASAQVIAVARELFNTLLRTFG